MLRFREKREKILIDGGALRPNAERLAKSGRFACPGRELPVSTLAAALASQKRKPSARCSIAKLIDELDDIDKKALLNALEPDSGVETSSIERALASEGHKFGSGALGRHRRRDCRCDAQ